VEYKFGGIAINKIIQSLIYTIFGTNLYINAQIRDQIRMLETKVPPAFRERELDDLGCGDGKTTVLLKKVFQPRKLRGFDVNPFLVKRAVSKGIQAEVKNLDEALPSGDLAVMWGVLHHLKDRETCIRRIREPVKDKDLKGFEMGKPLQKEEIENLVKQYLPTAQTFYYGYCIFIFYISPEYGKVNS
jgi:trans-aconitate methyltransferase